MAQIKMSVEWLENVIGGVPKGLKEVKRSKGFVFLEKIGKKKAAKRAAKKKPAAKKKKPPQGNASARKVLTKTAGKGKAKKKK